MVLLENSDICYSVYRWVCGVDDVQDVQKGVEVLNMRV